MAETPESPVIVNDAAHDALVEQIQNEKKMTLADSSQKQYQLADRLNKDEEVQRKLAERERATHETESKPEKHGDPKESEETTAEQLPTQEEMRRDTQNAANEGGVQGALDHAREYYQQYAGKYMEMIESKDIKLSGKYANTILDLYQKSYEGFKLSEEDLKIAVSQNPELLQSLWHRTQLAQERAANYAELYKNFEQKRSRAQGKEKDFDAEGFISTKGHIIADQMISMKEAELLSKITNPENPEMLAEYTKHTEGLTKAEAIEIALKPESVKEGPFRKLLQKEDGIIRFLITVVGPIWGYTVALANGAIWVQDPKNDKAAFWAASGAVGARMMQKNRYKLDTGNTATNYLNSPDKKIERERIQKFLRNHPEDAQILRSVNWAEVKGSDLRVSKNDRVKVQGDFIEGLKGSGWGTAELQKLGGRTDLIPGTHNQEQFNEALTRLESQDTTLEARRERKWVYKQFMGENFSTHDTREILNSLKSQNS